MKQELIKKLHASFEDAAYEQDGVEYWLARDLQELLGYSEWRNFLNVVEKAKVACENSGHHNADHFVDINKMVTHGKGEHWQIFFQRSPLKPKTLLLRSPILM